MLHTRSADGAAIAYEKLGAGRPLVILGGSLADHRFYLPLAEVLADSFTVYVMDRRGRGDSGDNPPYSVDREVDDVAAVIATAGGTAHLYGHSAGSALALRAAAAGLSVDRVVLADPPFAVPTGDDDAARAAHADQARHIARLNEAGDYRGSVKYFLADFGLPNEALEDILSSPSGSAMIASARVLPYDYALLGDGLVPVDLAARVNAETLVVAGPGSSPIAEALIGALAHAEFRRAPQPLHELDPKQIAALIVPFLKD